MHCKLSATKFVVQNLYDKSDRLAESELKSVRVDTKTRPSDEQLVSYEISGGRFSEVFWLEKLKQLKELSSENFLWEFFSWSGEARRREKGLTVRNSTGNVKKKRFHRKKFFLCLCEHRSLVAHRKKLVGNPLGVSISLSFASVLQRFLPFFVFLLVLRERERERERDKQSANGF